MSLWKWKPIVVPDLDRHRGKILLITSVRVAFFVAILAISTFFQIKQSTFFNTDSLFPLYILLITAFTINSAYLYFFEQTQRLWQPTGFLFAFDTLFITFLILITGVHQSIFLFLYLVNIILCGFVFQRQGAFLCALFTSASFSILLIVSGDIEGQNLFYTVGLNNLAFFSVAGLSGYLSEQLNFMGAELNIQKRDIKVLKDLNKIIVDNISSGLLTISTEFNILLSNRSAHRITGFDQMVGKQIDTVFPGMREQLQRIEDKRVAGLNADNRFEKKFITKSNDRLILGFSISPLIDELNHANGYIVIFQDLTEIVRLESAMRRQDKLAAVGKLAAGIAHEIRNPLASISGSIELLKSMLKLDTADENKLMDIMLKEITRLNLLITEFLEFVRPEDRKLEVCNVDQILNEVLDLVSVNNQLPRHVKQVRHINSKSYVAGDKNKLKQVFLNLVINAYQAMGDIQKAEVHVETLSEGGTLTVRIRDTGHGMSEATMKRLFEPFFTTKPKGTGLGLATAHKILEIHEAKIFVESHEDKGTEFTIRFNEVIKEGAKHHESQNTGS